MTPVEIALLVGLVVALLVAGLALARLRALSARLARVEQRSPVGEGDLAALRHDIAQALRHVAVVRYDAFGDMGGRLSFSAALLDANGDGLVLTSIHGRSESRTYAKGVAGGDSETTLTPEERQAVAAARKGSPTA